MLRPAPRLTVAGTYAPHLAGQLIRVYHRLATADTALLLSDFLAKLELHKP